MPLPFLTKLKKLYCFLEFGSVLKFANFEINGLPELLSFIGFELDLSFNLKNPFKDLLSLFKSFTSFVC